MYQIVQSFGAIWMTETFIKISIRRVKVVYHRQTDPLISFTGFWNLVAPP